MGYQDHVEAQLTVTQLECKTDSNSIKKVLYSFVLEYQKQQQDYLHLDQYYNTPVPNGDGDLVYLDDSDSEEKYKKVTDRYTTFLLKSGISKDSELEKLLIELARQAMRTDNINTYVASIIEECEYLEALNDNNVVGVDKELKSSRTDRAIALQSLNNSITDKMDKILELDRQINKHFFGNKKRNIDRDHLIEEMEELKKMWKEKTKLEYPTVLKGKEKITFTSFHDYIKIKEMPIASIEQDCSKEVCNENIKEPIVLHYEQEHDELELEC